MEVVYCNKCKKWINNEDIRFNECPINPEQIDPPEEFGLLPCCFTNVPWDSIECITGNEIIDALNEAKVKLKGAG